MSSPISIKGTLAQRGTKEYELAHLCDEVKPILTLRDEYIDMTDLADHIEAQLGEKGFKWDFAADCEYNMAAVSLRVAREIALTDESPKMLQTQCSEELGVDGAMNIEKEEEKETGDDDDDDDGKVEDDQDRRCENVDHVLVDVTSGQYRKRMELEEMDVIKIRELRREFRKIKVGLGAHERFEKGYEKRMKEAAPGPDRETFSLSKAGLR